MSCHFAPQLLLIWHLQDPCPTLCPTFRDSKPLDCSGVVASEITQYYKILQVRQSRTMHPWLVMLGLVPLRMCVKTSKKTNQIS